MVGKGAVLFNLMSSMPRKLADVANVFVGLQTSADDVFILNLEARVGKLLRCKSKALNETVELEAALLHPLVSGTDVGSFEPLPNRQVILFPYSVDNARAALIPLTTINRQYPAIATYLARNRARLEGREDGKLKGRDWHGYIYLKNMTRQDLVKLCVPRLVDHLHAGFDEHGTHYLDNVDVGGVTWRPEFSTRSLRTLFAMLNSQVLRWFFPHVSAPFRGGFRSANRQFIELLPIADSTKNQDAIIANMVDLLLALHGQFASNRVAQTARDPLMLAYWEQILNGLVFAPSTRSSFVRIHINGPDASGANRDIDVHWNTTDGHPLPVPANPAAAATSQGIRSLLLDGARRAGFLDYRMMLRTHLLSGPLPRLNPAPSLTKVKPLGDWKRLLLFRVLNGVCVTDNGFTPAGGVSARDCCRAGDECWSMFQTHGIAWIECGSRTGWLLPKRKTRGRKTPGRASWLKQ